MDKEIRRFPLPWTVQESESAFWVEDAHGKKFAYTYFRTGPRTIGTGVYSQDLLLTKGEARRIVLNVAKLPELLRKAGRGG